MQIQLAEAEAESENSVIRSVISRRNVSETFSEEIFNVNAHEFIPYKSISDTKLKKMELLKKAEDNSDDNKKQEITSVRKKRDEFSSTEINIKKDSEENLTISDQNITRKNDNNQNSVKNSLLNNTSTNKEENLLSTLVSFNLKSLMPKTKIVKLDGDYTKYPKFIKSFESTITSKLNNEK